MHLVKFSAEFKNQPEKFQKVFDKLGTSRISENFTKDFILLNRTYTEQNLQHLQIKLDNYLFFDTRYEKNVYHYFSDVISSIGSIKILKPLFLFLDLNVEVVKMLLKPFFTFNNLFFNYIFGKVEIFILQFKNPFTHRM